MGFVAVSILAFMAAVTMAELPLLGRGSYANSRGPLNDGSLSNVLGSTTQFANFQGGISASTAGSGQFGDSITGSGSDFGSDSGSNLFVTPSGSGSTTGQFVNLGGANPQTGTGSGFQAGTGPVIGQVGGGVVPGVTVTVGESGATVTRVVKQSIVPTVTQTRTIDHFVTLTDVAFQSVEVTLTTLLVQTVTARTRQVLQTPVNDRVALQTSVVLRPSTITITQVKTDFNLVTAVSVDYFTITHHSYIIRHSTLTTTATQAVRVTSTLVRTLIHTTRHTSTRFYTITDTVLVSPDQPSYH